jgi:hypothetical protein
VSPELEQKLYEDFPTLFANRESKGSCMAFGVECGDGWHGIIRSACSEIAAREKHTGSPSFQFTQVKEKWGALRLYYHGGDDYCEGVIAMAEAVSAVTCEQCGSAGERRGGGWIMTLCDACSEKVKT